MLSRFIALVRLAGLLFALAGVSLPAHAARHALVIGNNAYPSGQLRSAVNDAHDMSAALQQFGFEVQLRENVNREQMFQAIRDFGTRLREGDTAVFFYAGHAIQLRDRNYLIPIDARVQQEDDVTFYSLDVAEILQRMDRARTRANLIVLDACRDNPFASNVRVSSVGLAQMSAPPGTLIAYATAPGQVAREGSGRNGVYTRHLLRHMTTPDQPVEVTLKRVREAVMAETRGQQVPWDASSLRTDFVFAGNAPEPAALAPAAVRADTQLNLDKTFWESVKDSRNPKEFEAYLEQFPEGVFAVLARNRLKALGQAGASGAVVASATTSQPVGTAAPVAAPAAQASVDVRPIQPGSRLGGASVAAGSSVPASPPGAGRPSDPALAVPAPTPAGGPAQALAPVSVGAVPAASPPVAMTARSALPASPTITPAAVAAPSAEPMVVMADGSRYFGILKDGKPHGQGRLLSTAAGEYTGTFVDGVRDGEGEQKWPGGDRYKGAFKADRPHGRGVMEFANGDRYEGEFDAGVFSGQGVLTLPNGYRYDGQFVRGKRQGNGTARFPNGDRYDGAFDDDVAAGTGVLVYKDGGRYEGAVVAGKPAGSGVHRFAGGGRYEGEFLDGAMSGKGAYHFPNGDRHEGIFRDGVATGAGVYHFASGGRFEGSFTDNGRTASGVLIDQAGNRRPGAMQDGRFKANDG